MRLNKIILFAMAVCFLFITSSIAIVVNPPAIVRDFTSPGTYYHSSGNLAYFAVDHVMTFTQVVVDSTYVEFNNTKFNISSPYRINISLEYLDSDMTAASGITLVSFYAQTTTGNARFNISSFSVGATYEVFKNNVSMATPIANATGFIYFTNSVWSTAYFEIALLTGVLPTVTTNAATGIEETNATLRGTISSNDSTEYGFECGSISYDYNISFPSIFLDSFTASGGSYSDRSIYGTRRVGEKYESFSGYPINSSFNLIKSGSPTGDCYSRIRYVSNDTIIESSSPVNSSNVSGWTTFNFTFYEIKNKDIYVTFEFPSGTSSNKINVDTGNPSGRNSYYYNGAVWTAETIVASYIVFYANTPNLGLISYNNLSLIPGKLYHFRAWATNTNGTSYGSDMTFLTKPNSPDTASFTIVSNTRSLGLNWTKATGANTTLIVRKQGAYPLTKTDGTIVYNSTGSSYTNTGLTPGVGYGYRAWSYSSWNTSWHFSDENATGCEITKPEGPTGGKATVLTIYLNSTMKVRLNWTKGTGANNTIVVRNTNHLPTSWTDGTMIYNGTGISNDIYMPYVPGSTEYYNAWSYAAWIINPHLYETSINGTTISLPGGGLLINAFDENDHHNLTFNVKVSNQSGSKVYENTSCTNTLVINATLCPQGVNIQVIVSATGYHQRIYTLDIYTGIIYLLNAYLPPETAPGNGTENCELRPYMDSATITNHAVDAVINFTHTLDSMISVEIYNASLYGTYGGWIFVSSDKYVFTTASVTINETVLDANTTMARVNYYYEFCTGGVESALYNLRVVNELNTPIESVLMQVKRYINTTGIFVDVSSIYTDSSGIVNIYLIPDQHYKIFLNKTGYIAVIGADYIPAPPNLYGQTETKDFLMHWVETPPINYTGITFTAIRSGTTIFANYTDAMGETINATIMVYQVNNTNGNLTLIDIQNYVSTSTINYILLGTNTSFEYKVYIFYNHTSYGSQTRIVIIGKAITHITTPNKINTLLALIIGPMGPFLWQNGIMFLFFLVMMYEIDKKDAGKGMIVIGGIFIFVSMVGFVDVFNTVGRLLIPALFIIVGLLTEWINSRRNQ